MKATIKRAVHATSHEREVEAVAKGSSSVIGQGWAGGHQVKLE